MVMEGAIVHQNYRAVVQVICLPRIQKKLMTQEEKILDEGTNLESEDRVQKNVGASSDTFIEKTEHPMKRENVNRLGRERW